MPNVVTEDYETQGRQRPSALTIASVLVALVVAGLLGWLLLSDSRLAGQPVARLAVKTEDVNAAKTEQLLRAAEKSGDEAKPAENQNAPNQGDEVSDDEQSLLDAARKLSGDSDEGGEIRIVGAETATDNSIAASDKTKALPPVPDAALVAKGKNGMIPITGADGRKAWKVYARPAPANLGTKPRVAIVVSGLGISESATQHAIETLPPEVTLSFAPYGRNLQKWISKARAAGHEVLLELPMEPFGYPQNDPGPYTLLSTLQPADNLARLDWLMSRFTGYAGVMNYQGARFTSNEAAVLPVLEDVAARGLMYVDNGSSQRSLVPKLASQKGIPLAMGHRQIDPVQSPEIVTQSLAALAGTAKQSGVAVGIASGFPVTVDEIAKWATALAAKGVVLVPVTVTATAPAATTTPITTTIVPAQPR